MENAFAQELSKDAEEKEHKEKLNQLMKQKSYANDLMEEVRKKKKM